MYLYFVKRLRPRLSDVAGTSLRTDAERRIKYESNLTRAAVRTR